MTVFVETNQFNQMISYNPYAKTQQEKRKVKYDLLDSIKEKIGEKWYRLKDGTRQAFDMICFLSTERGFFYAGDEYLGTRYDIADRTVRRNLKELINLGQVVKVNRRSAKCNGRGKPIYLLVNHPYFQFWVQLLSLEISNVQTDVQTENAEIPCESKDKEVKKVSTYYIPLKDNNNHLNVKRSPYIKYVPKSLQHYQAIFGKQVKDLYGRIWLAAKKLNIHSENYETMQKVGFIAFEQLKQYLKTGKQLTAEQMNRIAYTIGYNQLKQRLDDGEIYDPNDWLPMPEKATVSLYKPIIEHASKEELDALAIY